MNLQSPPTTPTACSKMTVASAAEARNTPDPNQYQKSTGPVPIPSKMRDLPQWVAWQRKPEAEGKFRKVPIDAKTGSYASTTEPATWASFDVAEAAVQKWGATGIGFVFEDKDGLTGVDLDGCINSQTGIIEPWAHDIIKRLASYTETSPSRRGVHIIVQGKILDGRGRKNKAGRIEIYDRGRYFCTTGRHFPGTPVGVEERQDEVDELLAEIDAERAIPAPVPVPAFPPNSRAAGVSERARCYVDKMDPAVSGQKGHDQTFHVAMVLLEGFGLSAEQAGPILDAYSGRCSPPWSPKDLEHKLESAAGHVDPAKRGYLLRAGGDADPTSLGGAVVMAGDKTAVPIPERCEVRLGDDEARVNDEVIGHLARDTTIYTRGGALVRIQAPEDASLGGSPIIEMVPPGLLRDIITRHVAFVTARPDRKRAASTGVDVPPTSEGAHWVPAHPPPWTVQGVHQRGEWPGLRRLLGIAPCPSITASGRILERRGYDPETRLYLAEALDLAVPLRPSAKEVREARALLDDLYADFPFELASHGAAAVAMLLSLVSRPAVIGPVPIFACDAPAQGSGKSLVMSVNAIIAMGAMPALTPWPDSEEELRKCITSILLSGRPLTLFDNCQNRVKGGALAMALTGAIYQDRILGQSAMTRELPIRTIFSVTGNGLMFDRDCERRVIPIRLVPPFERPEERTSFRHPQLLTYALANRRALLSAALTLLRGWWASGQPDQGLPNFGSFEAWSAIIRNTLVWAEWSDPLEAKRELEQQNASEIEPIRAALAIISQLDNGQGVTASQLLSAAESGGDDGHLVLELATSREGAKPSPLVLGQQLGRHRDRIVGGLRLQRSQRTRGGVMWTAQPVVASAGLMRVVPDAKRDIEQEKTDAGSTARVEGQGTDHGEAPIDDLDSF